MRQIIFVNEARVELAPEEYLSKTYKKIYQDRKRKDKQNNENIDNLRAAIENSEKMYHNNRISLAPKDYWEVPSKIPEHIKKIANKLDNPSFNSKKMQRVWK